LSPYYTISYEPPQKKKIEMKSVEAGDVAGTKKCAEADSSSSLDSNRARAGNECGGTSVVKAGSTGVDGKVEQGIAEATGDVNVVD